MTNLKRFINSVKEALDPRANLNAFAQNQAAEREDFIQSLSSNELKIKADEQRLEAMVRQQLKEEFPNIEKSSSYDLLVDAVIHNYKSKQLQATDDVNIKQRKRYHQSLQKQRAKVIPEARFVFGGKCIWAG